MRKLVFFIPFYYTFSINRKGVEGVAFFLEFYLLSFFAFYLSGFQGSDWFSYIILIVAQTLLYEIGYIDNNTRAIRYERNPTLRHSQDEIEYVAINRYYIYGFRVIIACILFLIAYDKIVYSWLSILFSVLSLLIFLMYNYIRVGWGNRVLFALLRISRYISVLFFLGVTAIWLSVLIGVVNFINNLSWYQERTEFSLPRFFGTKIFDSLVYLCCSIVLYFENILIFKLLIFLSCVKILLFSVKFFWI